MKKKDLPSNASKILKTLQNTGECNSIFKRTQALVNYSKSKTNFRKPSVLYKIILTTKSSFLLLDAKSCRCDVIFSLRTSSALPDPRETCLSARRSDFIQGDFKNSSKHRKRKVFLTLQNSELKDFD